MNPCLCFRNEKVVLPKRDYIEVLRSCKSIDPKGANFTAVWIYENVLNQEKMIPIQGLIRHYHRTHRNQYTICSPGGWHPPLQEIAKLQAGVSIFGQILVRPSFLNIIPYYSFLAPILCALPWSSMCSPLVINATHEMMKRAMPNTPSCAEP